ncbi:MAG: sugar phosphate isomerase/epimerase [Spirochaetes bacterium]|uniref:Sugar phosphate isomerase/epimerase n=1 Tax=Candidatus Ornithospirochaeta stercoripullorum TaxID=2840899 RepID=A0A9D9E065_9SPIO|nr:sugar phosphate isomerase/epimerase [Candidatus Ornithospirochaeta stercoripullorum]
MPRVGYRAHDFGSFANAEELGKRIESIRPSCIQLALNKVIPSAKRWQDWDEEYISSISGTLRKHGVEVAIIGCYINPINPDKESRKEEIRRFGKSLSLASAFGCPYVGTETGTIAPDGGFSIETSDPKNLEIFKESLEQMIELAEKYDAYIALEAVARNHTISTIERMADILSRYRTDRLKTIFDPVNLIPYTGIQEKDGVSLKVPSSEAEHSFVSEVLDLYGDRLVAIHCKDYYLDSKTGLKVGDIPALTGVFRWNDFAKELRERNIDVPWLLENHNPATVKETADTIAGY